MSNLNLGQDWKIETDSANSRTTLKHEPSGNVYYFNENGNLDVDSLNNADIANAASGTAPVSQGDGTLAMEELGGSVEASETDDGSDITNYRVSDTMGSNRVTLLDITGSGTLLGGVVHGEGYRGDPQIPMVRITKDGGSEYSIVATLTRDSDGSIQGIGFIPSVAFESSLKIDIDMTNTSYERWRAANAVVKQ